MTNSSRTNISFTGTLNKFALPILVGFAFLVRAIGIGRYSIWDDEAIFILSCRSLAAIIRGRVPTKGSLSYQLLLYFWNIFSSEQFWLQLLSISISLVGIVLMYVLVRSLFDRWTALLAAFLMSVSPLDVYFSREINKYSLFITLTIASYLLFSRVITSNGSHWRFLVLINAALLYTHYYAVFVCFHQTLYFFVYWWKHKTWFTQYFFTLLFTGVLYLPWFAHVTLPHTRQIAAFNDQWITPWHWWSPLKTLSIFSVGYHSPHKLFLFAGCVYAIIFIVPVFSLRRWYFQVRRYWMLFATAFLFPLCVLSVAAQFRNVYLERYLIFAFPPFLICIACSLRYAMPLLLQRLSPLGVGAISFIPLLFVHLNQIPREEPGLYMKKDIRPAAHYLARNLKGNHELIIHSSNAVLSSFNVYFGEEVPQYFVVLHTDEFKRFNGFEKIAMSFNEGILPHFLPTMILQNKRFWFVFSSWPTSYHDKEPLLVRDWLLQHCEVIKHRHFYGLEVYQLQQH